MGLRINTNIPSLVALRNLNRTDLRQTKTFERLSTGLKINRSSDDPTGLALSENIRARIEGVSQAAQNTKNAGNVLTTADAALAQISDILIAIRKSVVFSMDGTATREQVAAEQDSVDASIDAIDRIASMSRYGDIRLLDGSSAFEIQNVSSSGIIDVNPHSVRFNSVSDTVDFNVEVLSVATQATARASIDSLPATIAASGGDVVLLMTGPLGTETIQLASGATTTDVESAVNAIRGFTGIYASGGYLLTEDFGSGVKMRLEQIGGSGIFTGGDVLVPGISGTGSIYSTTGADAVIDFEGMTISGNGNTVFVNTAFFNGEILLNPAKNEDPNRGAGTTGMFGFTLRKSGLTFQMGAEAQASNQATIGIDNMTSSFLGRPKTVIGGVESQGMLSTVITGQQNDLFTNVDNAANIISSALNDVLGARSFIGSFVADVLEPTNSAMDVEVENLTAANSDIRDVDFAEEIAGMTRNQILFQAGISVLGQANNTPQNILRLLQ